MRWLKNISASFALLCALAGSPALASQGSCVMPTAGTVSGLTFSQDVNACTAAILTSNSGASAPTNAASGPVKGQMWLDTTSSTASVLKIYDGVEWLKVAVLDSSNGIYTPPISGGTATVSSATTTDLCSVPQSTLTISGTVTITSFSNTCYAGQIKALTFSGALQLTYNASSMILPSAANITTVAGDSAWAVYLGGGNWKIIAYQRADGSAVVATAVFTGAVFYDSVLSPSALAGNTNDWAPTGLSTANTIRFSCSSAFNITGITAPATDGKILLLDNIGSTNACTLTSQDTSSSAANRFAINQAIAVAPLSQVAIRYDITTARWKLWSQLVSQPIAGAYRNLRVFNVTTSLGDSAPGTPATMMSIKADAITVEDANGNARRLSTVSCTIDYTGSGAAGLDTGSISAPNWYSEWVIYNPTSNATSCLGSLSSTFAGLTLPSGYTFGTRVGWNYYVLSNSLTQFRRLVQYNRRASYSVQSATNTNLLPTAVTGSYGSPSAGTYVATSMATFVPTTAYAVTLILTVAGNSGSAIAAPNGNFGASSSTTNPPPINITAPGASMVGINSWARGTINMESTSVYGASNGGTMQVEGWDDNL